MEGDRDIMASVNHWGWWVDSDKPTTGVVVVHSLTEWFWDTIFYGDAVNVTEVSMLEDWRDETGAGEDEYPEDDLFWEIDEPTYLLGDWRKDERGQYVDFDGDYGYSAIVQTLGGAYNAHVVRSRHARRAALCSPCCPGQCDLDSEGDFMAFDLPPYFYPKPREHTQFRLRNGRWILTPSRALIPRLAPMRRVQSASVVRVQMGA